MVIDAVRGLALACHPAPTVVVTVLGGALAVGVGAPAATVALLAVALLAGQLSIGWSNDWWDAARDRAAGRTDKPVVAGAVAERTVARAAVVAGAACVPLSLALGPAPGALHLAAVAGGWAYNLGAKATVWSPVPYAVSFGLLPVVVAQTLPGRPWAAPWAVAAAALLGVGAHVANTFPDLEDDVATGVRGLPHRLGRPVASVAAPAVLVVAVGRAGGHPAGPPTAGSWAGAAVAVLLAAVAGGVGAVRPRSRSPFALTMLVAAVCVVLLVGSGGEAVGRR